MLDKGANYNSTSRSFKNQKDFLQVNSRSNSIWPSVLLMQYFLALPFTLSHFFMGSSFSLSLLHLFSPEGS